MKKALMILTALSLLTIARAIDGGPFYVYTEAGSRLNHSIASGWMGDYGDLHMTQRWEKNPGKGKSCVQIKYTAERKQNSGWAGIYWQSVANNWGDKKTKGYDLSDYKKLKFMARGETGKEVLDKAMFGGISGEASFDTDSSQTDQIELTKNWKEYEIELKGMDLKGIISPFCVVLNAESNPTGATFYLDEIRYEK